MTTYTKKPVLVSKVRDMQHSVSGCRRCAVTLPAISTGLPTDKIYMTDIDREIHKIELSASNNPRFQQLLGKANLELQRFNSYEAEVIKYFLLQICNKGVHPSLIKSAFHEAIIDKEESGHNSP